MVLMHFLPQIELLDNKNRSIECILGILYHNRVFAKVRFSKFTSSKIVPKAIFAVNF